jgi:hypothetical protein
VSIDASLLPPGKTARDIFIYTAPAGTTDYTPLATSVVDATHVAAQTTHFSVSVSFVPSSPPILPGPPDAGTDAGQVYVPDSGAPELDAGAEPDASLPEDSGSPPLDDASGDDGGAVDQDGSSNGEDVGLVAIDAGTEQDSSVAEADDAGACSPIPRALACESTCGGVPDGCGGKYDCGPCSADAGTD